MMSPSWRTRVAITGACWLATLVVMAAMDLSPQPVLLAGLAAVMASALYLVLDTSDIAAPATWTAPSEAEPSHGAVDPRIRALHRDLLTASSTADGRAVHRLLVELIDDRLSDVHGIDRGTEPDRAEAAMGPGLTAFVTSPPSATQVSDPRVLSTILTHIEALRNENP